MSGTKHSRLVTKNYNIGHVKQPHSCGYVRSEHMKGSSFGGDNHKFQAARSPLAGKHKEGGHMVGKR